ncbi:MAG: hypothetical protein EZS28_007013 [Streblomastix strix]|uniref:Uncharacterized protein n=1 Tax=Streblomastix strix TaxID=222440 RepID=A0A5J4WRB8_9EUKA|nr:MAG: hypothetical protein EZS28_007013 [Streblomastix strix]
MLSSKISEVEPKFEKEIEVNADVDTVTSLIDPFQQLFQHQVIRCETPTLTARHRSPIFEENLTSDPSVCRWLLDIISEDEHMVKESAHFVLSENQLIRVVAYTFDVPEIRYNTIGLINVVKNIENQMNVFSTGPQSYNCEEIDQNDALLLLKVDKTELIETYNKTQVDALFDDKLNISDQIDTYTKTEVDDLLDDKLNISNQIDSYTKEGEDALQLLKAEKLSYSMLTIKQNLILYWTIN